MAHGPRRQTGFLESKGLKSEGQGGTQTVLPVGRTLFRGRISHAWPSLCQLASLAVGLTGLGSRGAVKREKCAIRGKHGEIPWSVVTRPIPSQRTSDPPGRMELPRSIRVITGSLR